MPVYICQKTCQVRRDDGTIKFYKAGERDEFAKCPTHFSSLAVAGVLTAKDLDTMSERVMRYEDSAPVELLVKYYKERYGDDLSGSARDYLVDRIIYARMNPVQPLSAVGGQVLAQDYKSIDAVLSEGSTVKVDLAEKETVIPKPTEEAGDDLDDILGG